MNRNTISAAQAGLADPSISMVAAISASCALPVSFTSPILQERSKEHGAGRLDALRLRTEHGTLLCAAAQGSYYVTLLLAPAVPVSRASFALQKIARRFAAEM